MVASISASGAGVDEHLLDALDLVGGQVGVADASRTARWAGVGPGDGDGQQGRGLALAQVVADRLAGDGRRRRTRRARRRAAGRRRRAAGRRRDSCGSSSSARVGRGEHGAEVQRALDGVLARLVAGDALGLGSAVASPRAVPRMSRYWPMLSSMRSSFHTSERRRRRAARAAGRRRRRRGRRPGWRRPRRSAGPRRPVAARRGRSANTRCVVGSPRRVAGAVHHVVVEQGEGVQQLEGGAGVDHRSGRRRRRRRRRSPSGRTPGAAACRRRARGGRASRGVRQIGVELDQRSRSASSSPASRVSTRSARRRRVGGGVPRMVTAGYRRPSATLSSRRTDRDSAEGFRPFDPAASIRPVSIRSVGTTTASRSAVIRLMRSCAAEIFVRQSWISSAARATCSARWSTSTSLLSSSARMESSSASAAA